MADFVINLLDGKKAIVRRLTVTRVNITDYVDLESKKPKIVSSESTNTFEAFKYVVTVSNDESGTQEYTLFKFANGDWFADHRGKIQIEDDALLAIKKSIIEK